jgi:phosphatidylglycerol:prolipoprotein diacylglycerol transferase
MNPPVNPPYYGWLMLAGIALSLVFWARLARRDDRLLLVYFGALLGAFLGGKVVYLLAEGWRDFGEPDMWRRLATGKTILGALLGGYAGVELAKKFVGYPRATGDWFALIAPASIVLGRIGCLLHGCCLGEVCEQPAWWTMTDPTGIPRWPAVPVEIGFNVAAMFAFWGLRRWGRFAGQHFHLYLIAYGLFRFVHEFWRATPRVLGPFTGYQFAALAVTALGLWGFLARRKSSAADSVTA